MKCLLDDCIMEASWELYQGFLVKLYIISDTESNGNEGHYFIFPAKLPSLVVYVLVDQQYPFFSFLTAYPVHQKYLLIVCKCIWTGATFVLMALGSLALCDPRSYRFSHPSISSCTHLWTG